MIFLPGIGDVAEDFERSGFIEEMRHHRIAADAVAVDAHYGYYAARAIHERITEDAIDWARAAGYRRIWLAGISLGGFGAISYAALHDAQVAGLLLFAPYLGDAALIGEIAVEISFMTPRPVKRFAHVLRTFASPDAASGLQSADIIERTLLIIFRVVATPCFAV